MTDARTVGAESWWFPRHYIYSAWTEHAPFGFRLTAIHRPQSIVELGTHTGFSLFVFAEARMRLGLRSSISAVDTWRGDDHAGFYGDQVLAGVQAVVAQDYKEGVELIRATFSDAAADFEDGTVDLLHIDGGHGYSDVKDDYETYLPKLSRRGVVLFHDTAEVRPGFGVHKLWDDVQNSAPSFQFEHGHGLGVLAIGTEAREVRDWISAANEDVAATRKLYETLGAQVDENYRLSQLPPLVNQLRAEVRSTRDELALNAADAAHWSAAVNELRASSSWRVTAPLRTAADVVRSIQQRGHR